MTLQWVSVAAFLYTEIGLGFLLCLGFISNARWKSIFNSRLLTMIAHHGTFFFSAFILMLLVLFTDSAWTTYKLSRVNMDNVNLQNNPQAELQAHMKLFRAERNLYLSGFSLFMLIILRRMVMLISKQAQVEASSQAALKQAQGASEQARKLMQENEELTKRSGGKTTTTTKQVEEKDKLLELVETLKEDLKETTDRLEATEKDMSAMKAQSEGLHREYDRVLDLNNQLEKKVSILGGGGVEDMGGKKDD